MFTLRDEGQASGPHQLSRAIEAMKQPIGMYTPLVSSKDEIRLVRLKSLQFMRAQTVFAGQDMIVCELEHSRLRDKSDSREHDITPYLALSYAWGAEHDAASVILSGHARPISANLFYALQQLRQEEHDVMLWVDQLSINQDDDVEKAQQVQLMKQIFQQASEVISWLGVQADGSEVVMATLKRLAVLKDHRSKTLLLDVARDLELDSDQNTEAGEAVAQGIVEIMRHALPAFTMRPYWCRLWVLQEFVVATKVTLLVGTHSIGAVDFEDAWNVLGKYIRQTGDSLEEIKYKNDPSHLQLLGLAWRSREHWWDAWLSISRLTYQRRVIRQHENSHHPRAEVLYLVMYAVLTTLGGQVQMLCSDPRDRVFSLLGLAHDAEQYTNFPDYKRSIESIYTEVSQTFLKQGHVDVLGLCQLPPNERDSSMPSWCVDWRLKIRLPLSGKLGMDASSGCSIPYSCEVLDKQTIKLTGSCVGRIVEHGSYLPHNQPLSFYDMYSYLAEVQKFCSQSPMIEPHKEEVACAYLSAPATLAYVQNNYVHDNTSMLAEYRAVVQFLNDSRDDHNIMASDPDVNAMSSYARELRFQLFRCAFITDQGQVGIASPFVQTGDLVCIFPGGISTYILRPAGEDRFMLVSDSYVYGEMHGEHFRVDRQAQSFILV